MLTHNSDTNDRARNESLIVAALKRNDPITFVYTDEDNVTSLRWAVPRTIRRCENGSTVAVCDDLARKALRQFCLDRMTSVEPGLRGARITITVNG